MSVNLRSVRLASLATALAVTIGMGSLASAQSIPAKRVLQDTPAPTEVDIDTPVALTLCKTATTPLDKNIYFHRNFTFNGKANDIVTVTTIHVSGNFGYDVNISSQNDVEIASSTGSFMMANDLIIKLPQDGNYKVRVDIIDPGAGDSSAGSVSIVVNSGMPAAVGTIMSTRTL